MSEMGLHHPFKHLKHKLWPKERSESNGQFDSWPLKVGNGPDLLACRWLATHRWKDLDEGYNFASDLISIRGLHTKLWGSKVAKVPTLLISPLGNPRTKCHLDVGLVERHKVYYMGEGGGFPQVQAMVSLVSLSYPWLVLASKMLQLCTNHFVLVLCRSASYRVRVSSWSLSILPSPIPEF
jgi:hypothetical protein